LIRLRDLVLYASLALGANVATADTAVLEALREGSMKKLVFASEPTAVSLVAFETAEGSQATLEEFRGKHIVLNFWATWCAPCRKEMPGLSALQEELGGDDFEVVTIATGRNPLPAMQRFFEEIEVGNLPLHRDPRQKLAREMAVLGLPVTVILDPDGNEIARLRGDADWDSDSAKAIIGALIGGDPAG
jgi:thiol-disulfide isomerase/thioredoxin